MYNQSKDTLIVFDIPEIMLPLTLLSKNNHLPMLDVDAVLDIVTEIIQYKENLEYTVPMQCNHIVSGDRLYSNYALNVDEKYIIQKILCALCFELANTLNRYGLYNNNQLTHKFKKVIRDNEILFTPTCSFNF